MSAALLATALAGCAASVPPAVDSAAHRSSVPPSSALPSSSAPGSATTTKTPTTTSKSTTPPPATTPAPSGQPLPLAAGTGPATQVITVVARSASATTAQLREWTRVPGGWQPVSGNITANLGSDGLTAHPSESLSATPIGSFTLTQAFGHNADPGTALPYQQTGPDDWWVSQAGPLYNTHQRCAADCAFTTGSPNEHLYYETPYYDYAVVIDYNTGPRVVPGAGSAFFLHVTVGASTQGCVAIPVGDLLPLMRWLNPAAAPRIVIGIG